MTTTGGTEWTTPVGTITTRAHMADLYGGALYSGILPSARTPNVLVYTDPAEGRKHGYIFDGPSDDGTAFYYTGHGPTGDQELKEGNSAIYEHAQTGRSLRLFTAVGFVEGTKTKKQQYLGEFHLDPDAPMRREPHVDRNNTTRTVIVFRLLPGPGAVLTTPEGDHERPRDPDRGPAATLVSGEVQSKYFYETSGSAPGTAQRTESTLVSSFEAARRGTALQRWSITIPGERAPLLTDVYDVEARILYEAKASSSRSSVRMAIGQLADYRRHITVPDLRCALLLPERPTSDLCDLIASNDLTLTYPNHDGTFVHIEPHHRAVERENREATISAPISQTLSSDVPQVGSASPVAAASRSSRASFPTSATHAPQAERATAALKPQRPRSIQASAGRGE